MINNRAAHFHYLHGFDDEDNLTVQVTDANSLLGTQLLEGDWEEALSHLDTPEGEHDATANNDPLGLFNEGSKHTLLPKTKSSALFASLYVRAPYPLIKRICVTSKGPELSDLMYALSVIPHEEQKRLHETQRKIPYRSRSWTNDEYTIILNLLLKECLVHNGSALSLLEKCPSWIIPSSFAVTPLAMAAYNPDVPSSILQKLCILEPKAIGMDCKLFNVPTIPLIIAAASPVPTPASFPIDVRDEVKRNRWHKVKLLMNKDWFCVLSSSGDVVGDDLPAPPVITVQQVKITCDEAMKRKEWELVREILKQYNPKTGEDLTLSPIQTALAQHDQTTSTKLQKQEAKRARDVWLHRNLGLVIFPVHAFMDLVYAVIPQRRDDSLVSPMS